MKRLVFFCAAALMLCGTCSAFAAAETASEKEAEALAMKNPSYEAFSKENVFGLGDVNTANAPYFIGTSYMKNLTDLQKTSLRIANVTFEPGCRNNWHIHHASS